MASSTVPVVKRSIVDNMGALLGDGWTVAYGWPGDKLAGMSTLWLGAASVDVETTSMRAGTRPRTETVDLSLGIWATVVDAAASGEERQEDADLAAYGALRALDEWIAEDTHLGVPELVDEVWLTSWQHEVGPTDRGEAALLNVTVRYKARLV
jgi:hypothetical protein